MHDFDAAERKPAAPDAKILVLLRDPPSRPAPDGHDAGARLGAQVPPPVRESAMIANDALQRSIGSDPARAPGRAFQPRAGPRPSA